MTVPTLKATIAWDHDGDHNAADADVSAVVRELRYGHVADKRTDHMPAAYCELKLLNLDGTYTPGNPDSALYRKMRAGRDLWVRLGYPTDDFDAADGTLDGRAFANDGNYVWDNQVGSMRIVSNKAGVAVSAATHFSTVDLEIADIEVGVWYARNDASDSTHRGGLILRWATNNNFLYVRVYADKLELRAVVGGPIFSGSDTLVADGDFTWETGAEHYLHVICHGQSVRVLVEDREIIDATTTAHQAETLFGIWLHDASGTSTNTFDDFGGWRSLFFGQIKTPQARPESGAQYTWISAHDAFERFAVDRILWLTNADRGGSITFSRSARQLAAQLLERVNWDIGGSTATPAGKTQMDAGQTLATVAGGIKAVDEPLLALLYALQDEEDGLVYMDGDGFVRLEDRTHKEDDDPHTEAAASLADDSTTPPFYALNGLEIDPGIEYVENIIEATVRRADGNLNDGHIWTLEEVDKGLAGVAFTAFEVRRFLAVLTEVDWELTPRTLVATTDYTANTAADGSGTDITAEIAVASIETERYNYAARLIEVRWGPRDGYLAKLKLRGTNSFTIKEAARAEAADSVSQGRYGERARALDLVFTDTSPVADAIVAARLARRRHALTRVRATLVTAGKVQTREAVHRKLSDQIAWSLGDVTLDAYIVGIEWDWTPAGTARCTWHLREKPAPEVAETDAETGEPIAQELRIFTGESDDGVVLADAGSGSAQLNGNDSVLVLSGATAGDDAHYSGDGLLSPAKSPILRADVEHAASTGSPFRASVDYFIGLRETPGTDVPSADAGDAEDIAGFAWDGGTLYARVRKEGEVTELALDAVDADTVHIFEIRLLESHEARFYIGGRRVATLLTNVPSTDLQWDIVANRNATQTDNCAMIVYNVEVRQAGHAHADTLVDAPLPNQRRITRNYLTSLDQIDTRDVGPAGNIVAPNGADALLLAIDTSGVATDHVAVEHKARTTAIGQDGYPAARNPWLLLDVEVLSSAATYVLEIALRETKAGTSAYASGTNYATLYFFTGGGGSHLTAGDGTTLTSAAVAFVGIGRHVIELRVRDGVNIEYLRDGVSIATVTANLPTSATPLYWEVLLISDVDATVEPLVLHRLEIEADPA